MSDDSPGVEKLQHSTEYEAWLLEQVYSLVEEELFPDFPDAVVYTVDASRPPHFYVNVRAHLRIGDWRNGFLRVGMPLVFVTAFKLLDMIVEWVLEEGGADVGWRFQEKIRALKGGVTLPPVLARRQWLHDRLVGLYERLEPLRGTIIHNRHFVVSDDRLAVSSSRGGVPGDEVSFSQGELRCLSQFTVSVLRYLEGSWEVTPHREKLLRRTLDTLSELHGLEPLGQEEPYHATVRVYRVEEFGTVDLTRIRGDLERQYSDRDITFDLRVVVVDGAAAIEAYWLEGASLSSLTSVSKDTPGIEDCRVSPPTDIKPEDLEAASDG